jgi:hypothetical protein
MLGAKGAEVAKQFNHYLQFSFAPFATSAPALSK